MKALQWTHAVRDVPQDGLAINRAATPEECQTLAKELEIPSIESLEVRYGVVPRSGGRLALEGTITARVTQECVVSLDPVSATVRADLDIVYSPEPADEGGEIEGSPDDLDKPDEEPIEHGMIDVGRVVMEELLAGLDPYPRRDDAKFDWTDEKGEAAGEHPFAALAKLKQPKE